MDSYKFPIHRTAYKNVIHLANQTQQPSQPPPQRRRPTQPPEYGTDFRHAVEFSKNEHTPPTTPQGHTRGNSPKLADHPHPVKQRNRTSKPTIDGTRPRPDPTTGRRSVLHVRPRSYVRTAHPSNRPTPTLGPPTNTPTSTPAHQPTSPPAHQQSPSAIPLTTLDHQRVPPALAQHDAPQTGRSRTTSTAHTAHVCCLM